MTTDACEIRERLSEKCTRSMPAMRVLAIDRGARRLRVDGDDGLLEALRRQDAYAPEELVGRYGSRAYRLAIGITRNDADAEEVVQDAFLSVVRRIETFRGSAAFGTWVYRIVANAAYQKLRRDIRRRTEISLEEVSSSPPDDDHHGATIDDWSPRVSDEALRSDLRAALSAALGELPPAYRTIVILRDVEGLSMADVATSAGISVANAKTRLHRARLFLRKRLAGLMASAAR